MKIAVDHCAAVRIGSDEVGKIRKAYMRTTFDHSPTAFSLSCAISAGRSGHEDQAPCHWPFARSPPACNGCRVPAHSSSSHKMADSLMFLNST